LLSDVLKLPNVSVIIAAGAKDNVIPLKNARRIADHFNDTGKVVFVEFGGRGHNPFEENSLEFVQKIQEAITTA
jgi:pimeloyl-ACP methyl ester carboxylesterase